MMDKCIWIGESMKKENKERREERNAMKQI